jgi:peptide/nickel transport system substrate-binding protein
MQFAPVGGFLDTITFRFYDDMDAMITDFKLGKVQLLGGSYDPAFDTLSSFPDTQQRNPVLKSQSYGLFFNLHQQPMNDIGLRQALAYAVPKQRLISDVFDRQVVALNGVYPNDSWAFSSRAETYDFNQNKAQELWDKVEAKPKSIRLLVPDKQIYQELAAVIGRQWQELGLNVSVITKPVSEMGKTINEHDIYDIVLLGEQSDADPDRYTTWHSTQLPPDGLNITGESNKRVDKALEDGRKELSVDKRKHDYDLFQYYLAKDAPVIWLYQPRYIYIWNNKVKGIEVAKTLQDPQDRLSSIAEWYVKTRRRD